MTQPQLTLSCHCNLHFCPLYADNCPIGQYEKSTELEGNRFEATFDIYSLHQLRSLRPNCNKLQHSAMQSLHRWSKHFSQTGPAQSCQGYPTMQMSNPESQAGRRRVTRKLNSHIFCHPSSNLGLPTKVVKGGRRLAFKSTLIKHQRDIKICQWNSFDETQSTIMLKEKICLGWANSRNEMFNRWEM